MPLQQFDERVPVAFGRNFSPTPDVGLFYYLLQAVSRDTRVDICQGFNYDSIAHVVTIALYNGSEFYYVCQKSVALGDGSGDVATWTDMLSGTLPDAFHYIIVPSGWSLMGMAVEAVVDAPAGAFVSGGGF